MPPMRFAEHFPLPGQRVVFRAAARRALLRGVELAAKLVRPTLGPIARHVAIQPLTGDNRSPEILDDGGTILRRVIELKNKYESMGAMIIRQLAWRVKDEVGDGTTTAVVLAESIVRESLRYIEAGGNAMIMRRGIEKSLQVVLDELDAIKVPITTQEEITRVASAATGNDEMGRFLGEMFDIVGVDGTITVEETQRATLDRRYIEGVTWDKGFVSAYMVTDRERMEATLDSPVVLITDHWLKDAGQLIPLMQKLAEAGEKSLFVVANEFEGDALALLVTNTLHKRIASLGVKAPGHSDRRTRILEDLAILTGAKVISLDAGDLIQDVQLNQLGRAQRIWANKDYFSIIGGAGDPQALRARLIEVKKDIKWFKDKKDDYEFDKARERLGKLSGGAAVLTVGAATETDLKLLKARAEDGVRTVRAAVEGGIVPGGGLALLACVPKVLAIPVTGDEAVGVRIVARALEEPMRRIIINAGLEDAPIVDRVRRAGPGYGFDARTGEVALMIESGIYDPARVVRAAVEAGISGAMMIITTDALVLRKHTMYDVGVNP